MIEGHTEKRLTRQEAQGNTYQEVMDTGINGVTNRVVLSVRSVTRNILRKQRPNGSGKVLTQGGCKCIMLGNKWVKP